MRGTQTCAVLLGILVLLGLVIYTGVAQLALPALDLALKREVREEFALPPDSKVTIQRGSTIQTFRGYVPAFSVEAQSASLDGLEVAVLRFDAQEIQFDLSPLLAEGDVQLEQAKRGELSFKVSEQALLDYWAPELEEKGLEKPSIELDSEGAKVSGVADLKLAKARIGAKGVFEVDGTRKVKFRAREFEIGGLNFGAGSFKAALSELTPIVELDQFAMEIRVDELRTTDGWLHVSAHSLAAESAQNEGAQADDSNGAGVAATDVSTQ